jgi:hypothetical protein
LCWLRVIARQKLHPPLIVKVNMLLPTFTVGGDSTSLGDLGEVYLGDQRNREIRAEDSGGIGCSLLWRRRVFFLFGGCVNNRVFSFLSSLYP